MKKTIGIIAISVLTASLLFGCKAKTDSNQAVDNNQSTASQNNQNQTQGNQNGRGQFQMPDMSGQVVSVSGNQVTIKVIKQQQFGQQGGNNRNNNGGNNNNNNNNSNNNNNNSGNGNGNSGNTGNGGAQGARQRRQLEFTGETKTITIPNGTQITTMVRGNQGRTTENLQVKDIIANDVLQIWFSDKDKGTISKLSVQEFNLNGNSNGNSGNNNSTNNTQTAN